MKYYVRVMRPVFQRAVFTVEAATEEAAKRAALSKADRMKEAEWARQQSCEPPVIELLMSRADSEADHESTLEFGSDVQHAYALLQADLQEGVGSFIAPDWLREQSALLVADVTQDWAQILDSVSKADTTAFYDWLARQHRPSNVVDFFAERDKRRRQPRSDPDQEPPDWTR